MRVSSSPPAASPDPILRARELAPLIEAAADRIEAAREIPPDIIDALHAAGMFRLLLPRSAGGAEVDPPTYVQVIEVIAGADASTAWCIGQASGCSMSAAYLAAEATHEVFGRDPRAVLAWGAGAVGQTVAVDGGWRVTGRWQFASGSRHATWLGGHCKVIDRDGTPRLSATGKTVERTMLFPREAASISDVWQVMGLRGTGSDTYAVRELFVPESHSLGRDEPAERRETGPLYKFSTTNLYAAGFAGVGLGIARAALDAFIRLARDKTPRDARNTLRENAVVQTEVAVAEVRLRAARSYLLQVLRELTDAAAENEALTIDQRMELRMASTYAIHTASDVVDVAYHEAGATAIFESNPFERRFRDMHAVSQQMQGRRSHFETVGQHLLGLTPSLSSV
ncbi:MAG: acyl-CoA dehydrogenase family protein [Acidisphaera sp.]|nr:acyl-CoA dehydrogenase family protein [Acidisphaera sp.]